MENNPILYSEKQSFKAWWIWAIIITLHILVLIVLFYQYIMNVPVGSNPLPNSALLFVEILILFFTCLFLILKLETRIHNNGISVRFYPFQLQFNYFAWEDILYFNIKEYSAIKDYGGWGIRKSLNWKNTAYIVGGKKGLELQLKNGRRVLIGTQKPEKINNLLEQLHPKKEK